jgi:hypothetical protein
MADATQTVVNQIGYNPAVAPYLQENMGQARALTYNYKQEPVLDANGQPVIGPDGRPVTKNIIGANGMPEIESFKAPERYGAETPKGYSAEEIGEMIVGTKPNPNKFTLSDMIKVQKDQVEGKALDPKYYQKDAEGNTVTEFKGYERQAEFSDLQKQAMQGARDMATTKYDAAGKAIPTANEAAQSIMSTAANTAAGASYTGNTFGNQYTAPANLGYTAQNAAAQQAGLATLPTGETATAATMGRAPTSTAAIGQAQQDQMAPEMAAQTGTAATGIAALNRATPQMTAQAAKAATLGAAPEALSTQFAGPRDVSAERVGAERINAPNLRDMSMTAAKDIAGSTVESRDIKAAKDAGLASLKNYQMGPAERVETKSFAQPGSADAYMSPYMQSVVGIQQREAQRAADIASTGRKGEQTRAGAFGGSRAAIMDAEAARNLATQQGDIQAQGLQEAYKQAQQQFNTEQSQGLQAQTANQQAGLTVGQQNLAANLGVQQLGEGQINLQTRLANLNNEQQAAVQNESNRLQAQGLTAGQAMQAALANQGVQQQANVQNLSAGLQTQGLGAQTGLQAQQSNQQYNMQGQLANQQSNLTAQQANQGMGYNTAMQNAQLQQQTALANQGQRGQYGLQQGQFNQAANLQTSAQAQEAQRQNQAMAGQYGLSDTSNQQQTNMANAGYQQQTGMANLANRQETQRQNQAMAGQYGLANLANRQQTEQANTGYQQQTGMANQALAGQYGMQQGTMDQQAAMQTAANRQAAGMYGAQAQNERAQYNTTNQQQIALANQAAGNRASEFGAGQNLASAGTSAQYGQAANQLNEQSGQFGANFGLQGQQAAMQGATGLSNIAGQGYNQNMQTNQLLAGYGQQQQGAEQQRLNTQYQDFLNEQNMPYKQLGFMANTASATPTANLGSTMYQAAPSTFSQVAGLGTAALGAFGASGGFGTTKANGGMVGRYAKGGLVRSRPQGLVALAIHSMA